MKKLLLTFYGDDFTGSTDALEQLTLAGVRTVLFLAPPSPAQIKKFGPLQAVGVAGVTRSLAPAAMKKTLRPALQKLRVLGASHTHYKVCSTFDSSPAIGSIGCAMDVGASIFRAPFVPVLAAAPALGRFTIFGHHFARFGIGSAGAIYRLDRHPAISRHPITPMREADLRQHLARQTKKKIALFDLLQLSLPEKAGRSAWQKTLAARPDVILFDAVNDEHLRRIGQLLAAYASAGRPLFSVGSSGIERALAIVWAQLRPAKKFAPPVPQLLVGSGSCSPVTTAQIDWALQNGFAEVALAADRLATAQREKEILRAVAASIKFLRAGRSVIVHTTRSGAKPSVTTKLRHRTAEILGTALGRVLREALAQVPVRRVCIAGGDTSGFAARALGVTSLEMVASLTPGAPVCRAGAPGSPADGLELVFKGGQVGAENYFGLVRRGKI